MKRLMPLMPFLVALLMAVALYGDDIIFERLLGHPHGSYKHTWSDALGKMDTIQFDGAGLNDADEAGAYTGTADSIFVIEIENDAATYDSIRWGVVAGSDTTGVVWRDTAVISADSNALGTGVYIDFAARAGHTTGNRWIIPCYADDEDTVFMSDPIRIWKSTVLLHTEVYATSSATNDSVIILYQRAKGKNSTDWLTYKADTTATIGDTIDNFLIIDTSSYGYEWFRYLVILRGEEPDTNDYYFYGEAIFY